MGRTKENGKKDAKNKLTPAKNVGENGFKI